MVQVQNVIDMRHISKQTVKNVRHSVLFLLLGTMVVIGVILMWVGNFSQAFPPPGTIGKMISIIVGLVFLVNRMHNHSGRNSVVYTS
jgi:hypothetical protein